jgi:hypothetical protein
VILPILGDYHRQIFNILGAFDPFYAFRIPNAKDRALTLIDV